MDVGKRDLPYDLGLPTTDFGAVARLNDQHGYLPLTSEAPAVGGVLRPRMSRSCTALDT